MWRLALRIRANARLGNYAAALADLAELRIEHPHSEWVDLTEAWCRRRHDDLPGAIRCIEQLLARNHKHHIAHFNLACYLALSGKVDRSIDALSIACGMNPECRMFAIDEPDFDAGDGFDMDEGAAEEATEAASSMAKSVFDFFTKD